MPILEILSHLICKSQKPGKNGHFCEKVNNRLQLENSWSGKLKFGLNIGADEGFMHMDLGKAWSRDRNFRGQKSAKADNLNRYISASTDSDWWQNICCF